MSERLPPPVSAFIAGAVPRARGANAEIVRLMPGHRLVRIHPMAGPHPSAWDEFRRWGPTKSRFDHHTAPKRTQARGVLYATWGFRSFVAAIAEYFQDDSGAGVGPIDTAHHRPAVTQFTVTAAVPLLDLNSGWVTRAGGNQTIRTGPRGVAREWARAIYRHHRDRVMGLSYGSSVWGPGSCVVLWESAAPSLEESPISSRLLQDPVMEHAVNGAAEVLQTYTL